ncbi:MAG: ribosome biogenesis GTP-binding protein YihA/YsxC [Bacteroidota bacterium]
MIIKTAQFITSSQHVGQCPKESYPEYAFIGRSNVGKSSLINMLTGRKKLAKTSATPGKTRLINHFLINGEWFLADLPGYGYAKVSKKDRDAFASLIEGYASGRSNLVCFFVLVDSRIPPQQIDLDFMEWLADCGLPFVIVRTKTDKLNQKEKSIHLTALKEALHETWEELPMIIETSAESAAGREELLEFIENTNKRLTGKAGEK